MPYTIELPDLDYPKDKFAQFCERFGCKLLKNKRGQYGLRIETDDPINFFWLGANLNFHYESGIAISAASQYLKQQ